MDEVTVRITLTESVTRFMTTLPITTHIDEILHLIDDNLVSQINAPTGSGKSIGVPKALAEHGKRVFVSVPTRVSAVSLCNYLKFLNPKISVGFAAEGNAEYNSSTKVVYATSGHVRRKLLGYFSRGLLRSKMGLNFTDILILDETHSGSLDNTIILSLWMYTRSKGLPVPKLVLLSATPTDLPVDPQPAVYAVPVPTPFPVEIIYDPPECDDEIYDHALEIVEDLHNDPRTKGDFLVFVPGSREADDLVYKMRESMPDAVILPAYSVLDADELKLIYNPTETGQRKVVISTNIAESSITIEGISVVIDTMLCKEAFASPSGATRLETTDITKDSAKQRLGRTGRTCPGKCYRLISEAKYEEMADHRQPEIERMPLHTTVMEFLKADIDPVQAIAGIPPYRVQDSMNLLTRLGMIKEINGKIRVTACGNFAPSVPLGVRNAAFLWRWIEADKPVYPGVMIAAIIDAHSVGYFYVPRKHRDMSPYEYNVFCNEYIQRTFADWIGETGIHTYLNMWLAFAKSINGLHYRLIDNPSSIKYRRWAKDNSVHQRQFWELMSIVSQTYRAVRQSMRGQRVDFNVSLFSTDEIMKDASPILQDIYSDNAMLLDLMGDMYHPITHGKYVFDNRRIIFTMLRNNIKRIVPLATHEITTRTGYVIGYVDLSIPYPFPTPEKIDSSSDERTPLGSSGELEW